MLRGEKYLPCDDLMPRAALDGAALRALELLDTKPCSEIDSIARLIAKKKTSSDLERFTKAVEALRTCEVQTLVVRIATTADPLMLWSIHSSLDKLGIAPCLRWPKNNTTPQAEFITWLADALWFAKNNPDHQTNFVSWQKLLSEKPNSPAWLESGYRIFVAMRRRQNVSSYTARGLALTHEQRQVLMMMPTSRMFKARLELQPSRWEEIRECLLTYATEHPDKSGVRSPARVSESRIKLYRLAVLIGGSPTEIHRSWGLLTGQNTPRQTLSKRLTEVKRIVREST